MQDNPNDPGYTLGDLHNEMLISRGATMEKYSKKTTKYRLAMPEELSSKHLKFINDGLREGVLYVFIKRDDDIPNIKGYTPLSPKQANIILDIEDNIMSFENDRSIQEDVDIYKRKIDEYITELSRAIRAGLIWHPLIYHTIYTHKALGNKEILRCIKRSWETGVKRPLTIDDIRFESQIDNIKKYRAEGKTWKEILGILKENGIIAKMSLQGLQKKYRKACEEPKTPPHIPLPVLILIP
ncbi:MAG: hypothetical protein ACLP2P_15480 [Desulfobaccales bacterium]